MANEIILSLFFGLGLFFQARTFIGDKLQKGDFKELLKDIGGGLLFIYLILYIFSESKEKIDFNDIILSAVYAFYLGFGASFTLSFKKRILLKTSEINLLTLNLLFLYYSFTRLGFDNWFTKIGYLLTFIVFVLVLFKNKLTITHKGLLYLWYIVLFMIIGTINIYQISGNDTNIYSSYLSSFFKGGIFLYIWIYFICLIMFTDIIDFFLDERRPDVYKGRMAVKEHFSDLANSFNITKIENLKIFIFFFALLGFLIINYHGNYISENFLIASIMFSAAYLNSKTPSPVILNNNVPGNK